jgi:hypothetical protein
VIQIEAHREKSQGAIPYLTLKKKKKKKTKKQIIGHKFSTNPFVENFIQIISN